jgi:hypothetical protein
MRRIIPYMMENKNMFETTNQMVGLATGFEKCLTI